MKKKLLLLETALLAITIFSCQPGDNDEKTLASTHPKLEKQLERGDSINTPITSNDNPDLYQRYRITLEKLETSPDFQVTESYSGKLAVLDETSHADAKKYSSALRKGLDSGVNFAGSYTVVTIGCGSSCQQHFIVDRKTGKVTDKIQSSAGARYSANSRTFIVNPPDASINYQDCSNCSPEAYVLQNGKLQKVPAE